MQQRPRAPFRSGPTLIPSAVAPSLTLIPVPAGTTYDESEDSDTFWPDPPREYRPSMASRVLQLVLINIILCSVATIAIIALATTL